MTVLAIAIVIAVAIASVAYAYPKIAFLVLQSKVLEDQKDRDDRVAQAAVDTLKESLPPQSYI